MALKLIRTDQHSNAITLFHGIHEFGRGEFLDCEDKRVSRCHGRLEVSEDKIFLTALHKNPCFVTVKDSTEIIIMTQGMTSELSEGDKFGLLPAAYWYRLTNTDHNHQHSHDEALDNNAPTFEDRTEAAVGNPDSPLLNFALEEDFDTNFDNQASPSLLGKEPDKADVEGTNDDNSGNIDVDVEAEHHCTTDAIEPEPVAERDTEPTKRQHPADVQCEHSSSSAKQARLSTDSLQIDEESQLKDTPVLQKIKEEKDDSLDQEEVKPAIKSEEQSLKIEPVVKTEPDVKLDPDAPSCSNGGAAPPPALPAPPSRERCMYGAQCYRRNTIHKQQFSHPGDKDWGDGDKAQCPWGASCARRDPRHWRDHAHPPGTVPPDPSSSRPAGNKKRNRKKRISSEEDELAKASDDEELPKLPAKRVRRTVKRASWSGSETENDYDLEDPFLTDGSDDWQPSD